MKNHSLGLPKLMSQSWSKGTRLTKQSLTSQNEKIVERVGNIYACVEDGVKKNLST